ncbi:MAG: YggS family pyridoxal phosphate-dependent enzyme [Bacteroidales bacterium]
MGVAENLQDIRNQLPEEVTLVAVSKTKPDALILEAYEAGQRDFGENKVQDLAAKKERLPADIRWHMIGHLQSNKVKYVSPFVHLIHGVDSLKLLDILQKEAIKVNRVLECLLQVHIAREASKFGFDGQELLKIAGSGALNKLEMVRIRGVMGMATYTENETQIRAEFQSLNRIFDQMKETAFSGEDSFDQRSYGMSGDYRLAVEEGSTMVRIGSLIFGPREY